MDMSKEEVVLCGASAYSKKYYLNEDFRGLPESVRDELKIMCVLFTCFTMRSDAGSRSESCREPKKICCVLWKCIIKYYM